MKPLPASAKAVLVHHGLRPRKSLGQNFLVNRGALRRIADSAHLELRDTVVEVGPGTGALTRLLIARATRVVAIEKDVALARALRDELGPTPGLSIVEGDMLETTPEALLDAYGGTGPYKVVANLPYYAAMAILRRFLEASLRPTMLVLLLQREVAQQIAAKPGKMSLLSVAVQLFATPKIVGVVKAGSFYPPPKVDSAIVRLDVNEAPTLVAKSEIQGYLDLVRAGFGAPRKQLANPLAHRLGIGRERTITLLQQAGIDPKRRAESLSLEDWASVYRAMKDLRTGGLQEYEHEN